MRWMGICGDEKINQAINLVVNDLKKNIKWFESVHHFKKSVNEQEAGLLLLKQSSDENIYEICRELTQSYPTFSILMISENSSIDIRKAMRAGAFDVISFPINNNQLFESLTEADFNLLITKKKSKTEVQQSKVKKARVMTICSTKGGVGKTTFTVNLASAFASQLKRVAVIDLDLQFGDVSMFFDCKPKKTIYEWVKEDSSASIEKLKQYIHSYNDYIDILPAPQRPEFAEVITDEHISQLVTKIQPLYDVVLIDTAPYMEDRIFTALEKSADIFLITHLDLPTLRNSRLFLDTLTSLSLQSKVKIILNRESKKKGLNSNIAEEVLGLPIYSKIPDIENIVTPSINEGIPFVLSDPRAKISKVFFTLAKELFGQPIQAEKKSFFSNKTLSAGRSV